MPAALYSLSSRIYALVALAILAAASLTYFILDRASNEAYDLRMGELRHVTDIARSHLAAYDARVAAGEMTLEEAQTAAAQILIMKAPPALLFPCWQRGAEV